MLIALSKLVTNYKIPSTGVLHIGAHQAEEREQYSQCGFAKVIWIEANPVICKELELQIEQADFGFIDERVIAAAISDTDNVECTLKVTNNMASSSLRSLGLHKFMYPHIEVIDEISLKTIRIDTLMLNNPGLKDGLEFLSLDIQGMELEALKGIGKDLSQFRWIYTEVNRQELYRGCALIWDLDRFLLTKDFVRREVFWSKGDWGDAFYVAVPTLSKFERCRKSFGLAVYSVARRTINFLKSFNRRAS